MIPATASTERTPQVIPSAMRRTGRGEASWSDFPASFSAASVVTIDFTGRAVAERVAAAVTLTLVRGPVYAGSSGAVPSSSSSSLSGVPKASSNARSRSRKRTADSDDDSGHGDGHREKQTSLVEAVAKARDACRFRYLTAAAVCVYGIPVYISK